MTEALHDRIEAVWRAEAARIMAVVARMLRDVGSAEELAQDTLIAALEHWPRNGIPDNPAAWLMATAKNRALDRLRQLAMQARKHEALGADLSALQAHVVPDVADAIDAARGDDIGDDLLRLIFTACHPVLPSDARVALALRVLGGLSTAEIARAYLLPEATIAQRIVRAKRTLAAAQVPFEVPRASERGQRLASVLEVIYLIFNEGYAATAGDDAMRQDLCREALRVGRTLAGLSPQDSEVLGLLALMELQASRQAARTDAQGRPVLLPEQDRSRWDAEQIARGMKLLDAAQALCSAAAPPGPYLLQAAIAACHASALRADETDWPQIVRLYDTLLQVQASPVVALNRAVAVSMARGPEAALAIVDTLRDDPALKHYPWLYGVQGDLLQRLDRKAEARAAFEHAAALTLNERDRALLLARAASGGPAS